MGDRATLETAIATLKREREPCRPQQDLDSRHSCCLIPYGAPPDRPDLATYSQEEQIAVGNPPTWDSPDILTNFWKFL